MTLHHHTRQKSDRSRLFRTEADRPLALLRQCPAYVPAPLRPMPDLARAFGVEMVWIKDETQRMGLGSFKALGGAYAVAQMICDAAETSDPTSDAARPHAEAMTFITASAGNHGLSVAAGAKVFGARAAIVLSGGVPEEFADRIRGLGSQVIRVDGSYEDSVAHAMKTAEERGWLLLADGSWEGYVERPALVMEGYTVLAEECRARFAAKNVWPTHVLLQAGVGGLAAAVAAHIREHWEGQSQIIVVEPEAAPCLLKSMDADKLVHAGGPVSNMGRLDCKDASLIAFDSLRRDADLFVTVSDSEATQAAELLSRHGIATTPSGAAGVAALALLELEPDARCLAVVSEGPEDA